MAAIPAADDLTAPKHDNIGDDAADHAEPKEEEVDDYMARFEKVDQLNNQLEKLAVDLKKAPHDQARVSALTAYVSVLQEQNSEMYSLLVEMNNFFAKK